MSLQLDRDRQAHDRIHLKIPDFVFRFPKPWWRNVTYKPPAKLIPQPRLVGAPGAPYPLPKSKTAPEMPYVYKNKKKRAAHRKKTGAVFAKFYKATGYKKAYKKSYKKRSYKKRAISTKGKTQMVVGRNFPPTKMRFQAENVFNTQWGSRSNNAASYNYFTIGTDPDGSGIAYFFSGDATGTRTPETAKNPRNWDKITDFYDRARIMYTEIIVQIEVASTAALAVDWNIYYWVSSGLDSGNPISSLTGNMGVAAPWQTDETTATSARTILDSSRRVIRRRMAAIGSRNGRSTLTFKCRVSPVKDRIGNKVVGGHAVRDVTNAPGGTIAATDAQIDTALTASQGVQNVVNVMCCPSTVGSGTAFNLTSTKITLVSHVDLYARILTNA